MDGCDFALALEVHGSLRYLDTSLKATLLYWRLVIRRARLTVLMSNAKKMVR